MPLAACPSCATRLSVPDQLGPAQAIRCPKCQTVFQPNEAPARAPQPVEEAYQPPRPPLPPSDAPTAGDIGDIPRASPPAPIMLSDTDFSSPGVSGRRGDGPAPRRRRGRGRVLLWA